MLVIENIFGSSSSSSSIFFFFFFFFFFFGECLIGEICTSKYNAIHHIKIGLIHGMNHSVLEYGNSRDCVNEKSEKSANPDNLSMINPVEHYNGNSNQQSLEYGSSNHL